MFDPVTAIAGTAVISGGLSYLGAEDQARATRNAANTAANTSLSMYNTTRNDLMPYQEMGQQASTTLADLLGYNGTAAQESAMSAFRSDPGYQFTLDQGTQAIERSAAAKGGLFSGNTGIALQNYGQGMADQSFSNYYNRLFNMATMGENAAAGTGSAGTSAANSAAGSYNNMGANLANISGNMYGGISNALNQGIQNYSVYDMYKNGVGSSGGAGTSLGYSPY